MRSHPESSDELFAKYLATYKVVETNPNASTEYYRRKAERISLDRADGWPIVLEARSLGRSIDDVWWFVNTPERYVECVPMLVRHLDCPHRMNTMDALVRALCVDYAYNIATKPLLRLLRREVEQPIPHPDALTTEAIAMHRSAIAVAVAMNADRSVVPELQLMVADPRYGSVVKELNRAIKRGIAR